MGLSTAVINVAYVTLFASTFTRSMPRLRASLVAASIAFIVFGTMEGNWSMVAWNAVTGVLNTRQLVLHARARTALVADESEERIRHRWFPDLDAREFLALWSMGRDVHHIDERLIEFGAENSHTWLILDGTVEVRRPGSVARLGAGSLVGEMTLVSDSRATAAVDAVGSVHLRRWSHAQLEALDRLNPQVGRAVHAYVERDLVSKVLEASDRGRRNQQPFA